MGTIPHTRLMGTRGADVNIHSEFLSRFRLVYFDVNDIYCIVVFSNSTENVNFGNISEVKQHTHTDRERQTHTRIQKYIHTYTHIYI